MLILLYIFLGLLFFDLFIACSFYFRKERPLKRQKDQLSYPQTIKLNKQPRSKNVVLLLPPKRGEWIACPQRRQARVVPLI